MKFLISILILTIVLIAGCTQQPTGQVIVNQQSRNQSQPSQVSTNPCSNVICNDYCSGNTRLINGHCVGGKCMYYSDYCENGCKDGRCNPMPTVTINVSNPSSEKIINKTIAKGNFQVTLLKIGYFSYQEPYTYETLTDFRTYIEVKNIGSQMDYFYTMKSALIAGDTQYDLRTTDNEEFGSMVSLYPGVLKTGYLAFKDVPSGLSGNITIVVGNAYIFSPYYAEIDYTFPIELS